MDVQNKFFNLNTLQTLLSALLVAIPLFMTNLGCTVDITGTKLDCSQSTFITPWIATMIGLAIAAAKFIVIPWLQPGGLVRNLFSPKVPVSTSGEAGTVKPSQVENVLKSDK